MVNKKKNVVSCNILGTEMRWSCDGKGYKCDRFYHRTHRTVKIMKVE